MAAKRARRKATGGRASSSSRSRASSSSGRSRSGGGRKYGEAAGKTVESAMRRRKSGTLKSGKGGKGGRVTSRRQAIAIGLSEARSKGAKVPARRSSSGRRSSSRSRSRSS